MKSRRFAAVALVLLALLLATAAARLALGPTGLGIPPGSLPKSLIRLLTAWPADALDLRLSRVVLAIVAGASLAASGVALQALLRNPLAEPFVLGLSSGAAAGYVLHQVLSYALQRTLGAPHLGALAGAAACMAVVYYASRRHGLVDPLGMLLTGVVLSTLSSALIVLMLHLAAPLGLAPELSRWTMGYIAEGLRGWEIALVLVVSGVCIAVLQRNAGAMDVATFSDVEAESLGVNLRVLRPVLYVSACVLAAGAVVLTGPLAFVGLVSPHVGRMLVGPVHRRLLAVSVLLGSLLVLLADTLAVSVELMVPQGRAPLGVFTAMVGVPVLLSMLRKRM